MKRPTLPTRTRRKPKPAPVVAQAEELSAEKIHKHLLLAPDGLYAWFRMTDVPWAFRSGSDKGLQLFASTVRLADLPGHRVHVRRTSRPVPYSVWAKRLHKATEHPLETPDDPEAPTWSDFLTESQHRIAGLRMEDPRTYIGVRVTTHRHKPEDLAKITATLDSTDARIAKTRALLTKVTSAVSKEGFGGTPVSSRVLGALIHGSVGLFCPVSVASLAGPEDDWNAEDMDSFTAPVYASAKPLAKTVTVRALREGREYTRHVAVMSVGRMPDDIDTDRPGFEPWLAAADALPFQVEWSWQFDVLDKETAAKKARFYRERAVDNLEQYENHDETPPPAIARGIRDAIRIEDEINEGEREVAVRLVGPIRVAVGGSTPAEALDRADTLINAYAMNQRISLVHTYGQYQLLREFIPGELASGVGFTRVMPAYYAATAVPNAVTRLGDGEGPYLGYSGQKAVFFEPTWGPQHDMSGLIPVQAGLGGGKSVLLGVLGESFVRRGYQVVIFEPSAVLQRLCGMPALRAHSRHIELSGAEPGTLNPYALVPVPTRALYPNTRELEAARREADAERRDLAVDALSMLLSERSPGYLAALEKAVSAVGGEFGTNPWRVIHALEDGDNIAQAVGAQLRAVVPMKGARLIFPLDEDARTHDAEGIGDALLTVITMKGITPPPRGATDLTRSERMALPVMHLAARYAMRAMYANQDPKLFASDEWGIAGAGESSLRAFVLRGALDSRKCNTAFVLMGQNPDHILSLGPEVTNLVGAAFVGRTKGEAARRSLDLLDVPQGHNYERALQNLEPGEFLFRDWKGNVDKLKVDIDHRPDLLAALDNTPRVKARDDDDQEPSWTDEFVTA